MKSKLSALILTIFLFSGLRLSAEGLPDIERNWGTYFGSSGNELVEAICSDSYGNVYVGGRTDGQNNNNDMATSGAFQTDNAGTLEGYIAKFDKNGVRQWSTFIGGYAHDNITDMICDSYGNVYAVGGSRITKSGVYGDANSYQPNNGGGLDMFIIKFNYDGERLWGTFLGGGQLDKAHTIAIDSDNNLIIGGRTESSGMASDGAHQTVRNGGTDGFITKFSQDGDLIWYTYYGGTASEYINKIAVDSDNNIVLTGRTMSTLPANCIATSGGHQTTFGGGTTFDAFIAKFNSAGVRQWGTYYGTGSNDQGLGICTDSDNNIYASGFTQSNSSIATNGSHQSSFGGGWDGFLVKFSSDGTRQWGTYYGGGQDDSTPEVSCDIDDNIYLSGDSKSGASIASSNGMKTSLSGVSDSFFAIFDVDGQRQYATYFGGEGNETSCGTVNGIDSSFYMAGMTSTDTLTSEIVSGTPHQASHAGGNNDAYVTKFKFLYPELPTEQVVLIAPDDNHRDTLLTLTFEWNEVPNATFYFLEIFDDQMTVVYYDSIYIDGSGPYSETLNIFQRDRSYIWYISGGNSSGIGPKSESRRFDIETPPVMPDQATLVSPDNNFSDTLTTLTFVWDSAANAEFYILEIVDDMSEIIFSDSLYFELPAETYSEIAGVFEYGKSYAWSVTSGNSGGLAAKSETRIFSVEAPVILPDQTVLISPEDNYSDTLLTLTFEWNAAANADYYFLEVLDDDLSVVFFDSLFYVVPTDTLSKTISVFEYGKSYSWTVVAGNENGLGQASESWAFSIESPANPLGQVELIEPVNAGIYKILDLPFKWNSVDNADFYILEVFNDQEDSIYRDSLTYNDQRPYSEWLDFFEYGESYSWSVTAGNSMGFGLSSELWTIRFVTPHVDEYVKLIAPEDNYVDTLLTITFEWSSAKYAEFYILEILNKDLIKAFSDTLVFKDTAESYSQTLDLFDYNQSYSWTVGAGNSRGPVTRPEVRTFTTKTPSSVEDYDLSGRPTMTNNTKSNTLTLKFGKDINPNIKTTIYDMLANKIMTAETGNLLGNELIVNYGDLTAAVYFLRLECDGKSYSFKFIAR